MGITREMSKILSTSTAITTDAEISAYNYLSQTSASTTYATISNFSSSAWTSFNPQLDQGTTNISKTINYCKYIKLGKTVIANGYIAVTANGTAGANVTLTLPLLAASGGQPIGSFIIYGSSGNVNFAGTAWALTTSQMAFRSDGSNFESYFGNQPNRAIVNIDSIAFSIVYEVA